jgi:tetratricopeptide (TPR) repeat protein
MEKPSEIEKVLPALEEAIAMSKQQGIWAMIHFARGRVHEMREEYAEALKSYQKQLKVVPSDTDILLLLGRCYRLLKDYQKAEEYLLKMLKIHPFGPEVNYELALLSLDKGDKNKAKEHMRIAMDIWKYADPHYKPAQRAKEKLAELN